MVVPMISNWYPLVYHMISNLYPYDIQIFLSLWYHDFSHFTLGISNGCPYDIQLIPSGLSYDIQKKYPYDIQICLSLPSGKLSHNYGKSPFLMGKSTISMVIFNSYVKLSGHRRPLLASAASTLVAMNRPAEAKTRREDFVGSFLLSSCWVTLW
jgi:hypothetical protein